MINMPFQKLIIWQKRIELTNVIYDMTDTFPKSELYGLSSQMQRAAVSVPSNISEGSQRGTKKDFGHFILMAKGSLAELYTQVVIAQRRQYANAETVNTIHTQISELDKMLYSFFKKLSS